MHIISMKEMFQVENNLGEISYDMCKVARNDASCYGTIGVLSTIAGLITLCLFVGLLISGDIAGAAGCFTGSAASFIILKMAITRMRYAEVVVAAHLQRNELAKFKQLME